MSEIERVGRFPDSHSICFHEEIAQPFSSSCDTRELHVVPEFLSWLFVFFILYEAFFWCHLIFFLCERFCFLHQVKDNLLSYSQHKFASNVVEKCLQYGTKDERGVLIQHLLYGHSEG